MPMISQNIAANQPRRAVRVVHWAWVYSAVLTALSMLAVSLVGLLTPKLTGLLFGPVLQSGSVSLLLSMAAFMVCVSVSQLLLRSVSVLLSARISTKLDLSVQAATMMRILSLPADFFKQHSAGELSDRARQIQSFLTSVEHADLADGSLFVALVERVIVGDVLRFVLRDGSEWNITTQHTTLRSKEPTVRSVESLCSEP